MLVQIIAEVGSVHDGSIGNALRLITMAAECGVTAVKFQTHIPEAETLPDAPMPAYFKGEPRFDYFRRTGFSESQWQEIRDCCHGVGVSFVSSPFSEEAVELLERVRVDGYKVASGEVTNLPLLHKMAATGKPVLLSSGMSSWEELDAAVEALRSSSRDLTILQCTSAYPCPYEQVGLNVMREMAERYDLQVGLSDHTLTTYASFAAVALGATVIERHVTFSRYMYGSDAKHSLEPSELRDLVQGIRAIEIMLASDVDKHDVTPYGEMKRVFQKSLVTVCAVPAGTTLTREMIGIKKPGTGLPPSRLEEVIGAAVAADLPADTVLQEEHIVWGSA